MNYLFKFLLILTLVYVYLNLFKFYARRDLQNIVISKMTDTGMSKKYWETELENENFHCTFKWEKDVNADAYWWDGLRISDTNVNLSPKYNFLVDAEPYHLKKTVTDDNIKWKTFKKRFDGLVGFGEGVDVEWQFGESAIKTSDLFYKAYPTKDKRNEIVFINRNCNTWGNRRENIVKALIKDNRIPVKAYGPCLKNANLRGKLDFVLENKDKEMAEKFSMMHKAKFCIAMENSVVSGYVSEKIWEALVCGCVPIYLGDFDTLKHRLPQPMHEMVLSLRDFDYDPKQLMDHLVYLSNNELEYDKYLEWKFKTPTNEFKQFRDTIIHIDPRMEMCKMVYNYKNAKLQ